MEAKKGFVLNLAFLDPIHLPETEKRKSLVGFVLNFLKEF